MCKSKSYLALSKSTAGFPGGTMVEDPPADAGDTGDAGSIPGVGKTHWRRKQQPTPVFLPGKSHGQRSLAGYSPRGHQELNTTERLSIHTHKSIAETTVCSFWRLTKIWITCLHVTCLHGELLTDTKDIFFSRNPHDHLSAMPERMGTTTIIEDYWVTLCQVLFSEFSKRYTI